MVFTDHSDETAAAGAADPGWGPVKRLLFRFAFAYLTLYNLPFPLDGIPYLDEWVAAPYKAIWDRVVPEVGHGVFGVEVQMGPSGSGDRAYNYVQATCELALAGLAAALWTALDRRGRGHPRLYQWLRVYVRLAVGAAMVSYGVVKVIKMQFPDPSPSRLLQPLGEFSPMGLLWTFMGVSAGYTAFAGAAEVVGGVLLTARRTALLGALISGGVMMHVLILNLCYDVPVKLYSAHLLGMCAFLIAPDARRLLDFFALGRSPGPPARERLFSRPALDRAGVALRTLAVAWTVGFGLVAANQARSEMALAPKSPLHGVWDVEDFALDGKPLPPLLTESRRWRRVVVDDLGRFVLLGVQPMTGPPTRLRVEIDPSAQVIRSLPTEPSGKVEYAYELAGPDRLILSGTRAGEDGQTRPFRARLKRFDAAEFPLLNRGFRWVSESPFNR